MLLFSPRPSRRSQEAVLKTRVSGHGCGRALSPRTRSHARLPTAHARYRAVSAAGAALRQGGAVTSQTRARNLRGQRKSLNTPVITH